MTPPPSGWKCPKRIGFLFPHACTRLTPEGCPDCQNGQVADPYIRRTDRYYYNNYDYYDDSLTGLALVEIGDHLDARFTEADGESLITPDDTYENDMSAS
jgi:hypothetical protein